MTKWIHGGEAGLLAGVAWGLVTATAQALVTSSLGNVIVILLVVRIAWGLALGLIFSSVAEKAPAGMNYGIRGLIFGAALCIVELVGNIIPVYFGVAFDILNLTVDFVGVLVFGYVVGMSYGKFKVLRPQ